MNSTSIPLIRASNNQTASVPKLKSGCFVKEKLHKVQNNARLSISKDLWDFIEGASVMYAALSYHTNASWNT